MSKYKAGDKVVLDILATDEDGYYKLGNEIYSWWDSPADIDIVSEPLSEYTEKMEKKNENKQKRIEKLVERLHRQAAEITRLLAENAELKGLNSAICDVCKHDEFLKETRELARAEGQEEAWELAQKIASMKFDEAAECFPDYDPPLGLLTLTRKYSYSEAAAKVAEWERQKEEICVGDVLLSNSIREKCVVTANCNGIFTLLWKDGSSGNHGEKAVREYEKVGHIDVDAWLAQIGGEE